MDLNTFEQMYLMHVHCQGVRLEEAKAINKSVSALGNCVAALAGELALIICSMLRMCENVLPAENAKSGKAGHVPLRDSVLTRLLSRALTGDSKTVLCVNLSPCAADYDET